VCEYLKAWRLIGDNTNKGEVCEYLKAWRLAGDNTNKGAKGVRKI
jgi:hypothetical protein